MKISHWVFVTTMLFMVTQASGQSTNVAEIKAQILTVAEEFSGKGDPDFKKQKTLDILVKNLLEVAPQAPIKERLPILAGVWKQVWGPYDYRNDQRGVDPELGIDEIYQVVSPKGYYYNVAPFYKNGDRSKEKIGLLRGEYKLDPKNSALLEVRFTSYPGVSRRPAGLELWDLAELAESSTLPDRTTILPDFIVKLFFAGGNLREVYTDEDLRILYGSSRKNFEKEAIYIMTRVK